MLKDKAISAIYLPNGTPLKAGERVVQSEYAETLTLHLAAWRRGAAMPARSATSWWTT